MISQPPNAIEHRTEQSPSPVRAAAPPQNPADVGQRISGAIDTCRETGRPCWFEYERRTPTSVTRYQVHATILDDQDVVVVARALPDRSGRDDALPRSDLNSFALTQRQLAVLRLVAAGATDKEIAARLGISSFTASKHIGNILRRLDVGSRTEATVAAMRAGLITV